MFLSTEVELDGTGYTPTSYMFAYTPSGIVDLTTIKSGFPPEAEINVLRETGYLPVSKLSCVSDDVGAVLIAPIAKSEAQLDLMLQRYCINMDLPEVVIKLFDLPISFPFSLNTYVPLNCIT